MGGSVFTDRLARLRAAMAEEHVDAVLLSVGADLPYFCGYEAMPLERLTMLVVSRDADALLIVPRLEAPRVVERPEVFTTVAWDETDDPMDLVTERMGAARVLAVGDQMWARFVVDLLRRRPDVRLRSASELTGPIRAVKAPDEVAALRRAGAAVDAIAAELQSGTLPLVGRTEAAVAADIRRRILETGHRSVNFVLVATGANAASPHHEPDDRVIEPGHGVFFDFGGTMSDEHGVGYCSDITRCVWLGPPPTEFRELYAVLREAQAAGIAAARPGEPCEAVDGAARSVIVEAGHGDHFVHRTGHGIGVEAHEDPYMVAGNREPIRAGNAFSVEPGIYVPGRWGARLEDIVVATPEGPDPLNEADHDLAVLDL